MGRIRTLWRNYTHLTSGPSTIWDPSGHNREKGHPSYSQRVPICSHLDPHLNMCLKMTDGSLPIFTHDLCVLHFFKNLCAGHHFHTL